MLFIIIVIIFIIADGMPELPNVAVGSPLLVWAVLGSSCSQCAGLEHVTTSTFW